MRGAQARQHRRIAAEIRRHHKQDVEDLIAKWPWYKRAVSWLFPKIGERWSTITLERAEVLDEFAERRTYKWIKRHF
jgi:hypothetical protein